ncbi:YbaB/EbfC family nucleoid-associated protein [Cellulomonas sp. DKR-3]|uniref:YbaB/EbfC family nucleoid-associated protein n=1 Tax=Cellulomonas fulva TaxID=2835530 RepID=A0ABS5TZT0_9CELL|nr:YbaB/EbfC family nucleoid-associated protein [Cellulomonas fulva]MBT0994541.1 YbaB/EbfC family nucleoid-associated protein [Cellulomonas fulva]
MDPQARVVDARDRLKQLQLEAHQAAAETARTAARIEQRTYAAWSAGREVRVTLGPDALLQGVQFTPHAMRTPPRALAAATMDAHRRAVALLRAAVDEAVGEAPASVGDLSAAVAAAAHAMLPAADESPDAER